MRVTKYGLFMTVGFVMLDVHVVSARSYGGSGIVDPLIEYGNVIERLILEYRVDRIVLISCLIDHGLGFLGLPFFLPIFF